MESLIYLAHRIPFPPNKGDKIRSYHMLRFLAERYRVFLGTFVDDADDRQYVSELRELCADVRAISITPWVRTLTSATAMIRREPLSLPYYRSDELRRWVERTLQDEHVRRFVAFSTPMAQYAPFDSPDVRTVIDFVDVDSEKWRQYANRRRWPLRWIYQRESEQLLAYERGVAAAVSSSIFVTEQEAALFRKRVPGLEGAVHAIINGVDTRYFSPELDYANPYPEGGPVVVFTGMMDYWANVDAVEWFANEAFPLVRDEHASARFVIAGARPTRAVMNLGNRPGVEVTGRVPDMRPYLAHADVVVAPLRIARGIQNKILEALAMARPLVATSAAVEGLDVPDSIRDFIADEPARLAQHVTALLDNSAHGIGEIGRAWTREHHDWSETLKPLEVLLETGTDSLCGT